MEKKTMKEKMKELTDRLEQGVKNVFESGAYENYLKVMSKFHRYSYRNTILIWMQNPDATYVAGFDAWKNDFHRSVKKGEKGIRIFAPSEYKIQKEQQKIDPVTNLPVVDGTGQPVMETVEIKQRGFMATTVFDISQTEGKELPEIIKPLNGEVKNFDEFMKAIESVSPVPIEYGDTGKADGYFSLSDNKIVLNVYLGPTQTMLAALHEVAHAKLHNLEAKAQEDEQGVVKDKQTKEVEAESIAYVVCQRYKGKETVHFLNQVDEADLLALMEEEEIESLGLNKDPVVEIIPEEPEEIIVEEPAEETGSKVSAGVIVSVMFFATGILIVGYAKMKDMKKQKSKEKKPEPEEEEYYEFMDLEQEMNGEGLDE